MSIYINIYICTHPDPDLAVKNLCTIKSTNAFYFIKLLNYLPRVSLKEKSRHFDL